jgi:F0F1-type ATP synthase assembly protein I
MKAQDSKNKPFKDNTYLKYSGMGFQMLATILIGLGLGVFLDNKLDTGKIFTAICTFVFVIASLYLVLRDFIKSKD